MKGQAIGIEFNGQDIMTDTHLLFSQETRDTKPWIFEALDAKEDAHAVIASHVMADCITRSKAVAKVLIEDESSGSALAHMIPTMVEAILWRPGPVEGEIEMCTVSGAPHVCDKAFSEKHGRHLLHMSHPDMGTIGQLIKLALEDFGGDEWNLLSFMTAGSDMADKILPSGETVEASVIANEIICPIDPHEDQRQPECDFYTATYLIEIAEGVDGERIIRDHLDEGKEMDDLDLMGFASQHQFQGIAATASHPLNLAGCLIKRLQTRPYQGMLDATGASTKAPIYDGMAGMMFITGLLYQNLGFDDEAANPAFFMMTASYTEAAARLIPVLSDVSESLSGDKASSVANLIDMLKDAIIAFNLFEWSMCALSDNLHRSDQLKWSRLKNLMAEIGGTDA